MTDHFHSALDLRDYPCAVVFEQRMAMTSRWPSEASDAEVRQQIEALESGA